MGFIDKLASYVAWALAGTLFFTVGWIALEPADPLGPVSLMTGHGAAGMLIQASLLGVVAAFVGTAIIGRKLPDAGTFAAALGLGLVSLRGGTMEFLLVRMADHPDATVRGLALKLAVESVGWVLTMAVALVASAVVSRWLFGNGGRSAASVHEDSRLVPAGWDIPLLGALLGRPTTLVGTSPAAGVRHVAIGAVVMLAAHRFLSTGVHDRVLTHGQSCFIVGASVSIGVYFAFRFAPVRSALWPVLAVFVYGIACYVIAAATTKSASALPANVPTSHFLIALPIQTLGVGCAAAVGSFWWRKAVEAMMHAQAYDGDDRQRPIQA